MKRAVIIGATSGIGEKVAEGLLKKGWTVGVAGRRYEALQEFQKKAPERIYISTIDVTSNEASEKLLLLITAMGGMDLFFLSSGIGKMNKELQEDIELSTCQTNVLGFIRMTTSAFRYFRESGRGHIAVISSIAGTKGLAPAPAYSASKRFQNIYIDALAQLSNGQNANIYFTDIRPGFVETDLLNDEYKYPMLMNPEKVATKIISALEKQKRIVTIDWRYRVMVFFWHLIPRYFWERCFKKMI